MKFWSWAILVDKINQSRHCEGGTTEAIYVKDCFAPLAMTKSAVLTHNLNSTSLIIEKRN